MKTVRAVAVRLHRWIGLAAGIPLLVIAITGSILVFRPELEVLLHPELLRVEEDARRIPVDQALAAVDEPVALIAPPRRVGQTYRFYLADEGEAFVDPRDGSLLGTLDELESPLDFLFHLHAELLADSFGEVLVGICGLLLLLLSVTGMILWWPSRRRGVGMKVKWNAVLRRLNYDLHRAGGFWTLPFLGLTALTGAGLVFYAAAGDILNAATRSPVPAPPPLSSAPAGTGATYEHAFRTARARFPEGEISYLIPPADPRDPIVVRFRLPGEMHPNGRSYLYIDRWTGEVLGAVDDRRAPAGTRMLHLLYPLHIGRFGGLVVKLLYVVLGFAPAVLAVTGAFFWWDTRSRGGRTEKRRRVARQSGEGAGSAARSNDEAPTRNP